MDIRKVLLAVAVLVSIGAQGQMILYSKDSLQIVRTKVDSSVVSLGNRWNATGLVVGTNMAVWGFDRFVTNADFARISLQTMQANIHKGFVWDNDFFSTNLFMHPYHGGLYFNAARINGLNYWQSVPYSMGGSLMWEMFMEKEYPSINDFIATSIGGTGFGEVTFRLSDRIIDNRTRGWERFGREASIFIVSPVRGLNRIVTGRAWKVESTRGNFLPPMPLTFYVGLGFRNLIDDGQVHDDVSSMASSIVGFTYGNPYDDDNDRPYDYFTAQVTGNIFSIQPIISRIRSIGMLYSDNIHLKKSRQKLTWGVYQHFNYFESASDSNHVTLYPYKLSEAASIGPGLMYRKSFGKNNTFYASTYLSAILLGSSQSDHYRVHNRDYNLGSGFSSKLSLEWLFNERFAIRLNSEDYRIYTWMGRDLTLVDPDSRSSQGDRSNASLSLGSLNVEYLINRHLFLSLESIYNYRLTLYKHYPTVEHGVTENSLRLGYLF